MNHLKKIGKAFGYFIGIIFISTILITLLSYFHIIQGKVVTVFLILTVVLALFFGGFLLGKQAQKKGWLEGAKIGGIFIVISILFQYLGLNQTIQFPQIILYLIWLLSSMFGGVLGINYKKT